MTTAYDKDLRKLALQAAVDLKMSSFVREGVYVHISGPNYETPSESFFLRNIGADAVGMSTAPEVTVARHSEIKVLGELFIETTIRVLNTQVNICMSRPQFLPFPLLQQVTI